MRKYLLRLLFLLARDWHLYKNKVIQRDLFPQKKTSKQRLLSFAKKHIPYYKKNTRIDKERIKQNLAQLRNPRKQYQVISYQSFLLKNMSLLLSQNVLIPVNTSGSTGNPLQFYKAKKDVTRMLLTFLQVAKYYGWREGQPIVSCWQQGMYYHFDFLHKILTFLGFPFFIFERADDIAAKEFVCMIKHKNALVLGFPSYLVTFATYIKKKNLQVPKIQCIITSGEMLFDYQRKLLEEVFKTKVYNMYASTECGIIAVECRKNQLHILEEEVYVEEKKGTLTITLLHNYDLPLINYDIGDCGKVKEEKCRCGVRGKILKKLEGRREEFFFDKKGKRVFASYLRQLLLKVNEASENTIIRAQFMQEKSKRIHCSLELANKKSIGAIEKELKKRIRKELGLLVSIKVVKNLLPRKGKFKFLKTYKDQKSTK